MIFHMHVVFICVHIYVHAHVYVHACMNTCGSEISSMCSCSSGNPLTSWDKVSHWSWNLRIDSASMADWWSLGTFLVLQKWESRVHLFYVGAGNLKLGPHAKLSSQPNFIVVILKLFRSVMKIFPLQSWLSRISLSKANKHAYPWKGRAPSLPTSSAPPLETVCAVISVCSAGSGRNEKAVGSISWRGSSGLNKMHSRNIQDHFSILGVLNQWSHIPGNAETGNSSQECSLLLLYY